MSSHAKDSPPDPRRFRTICTNQLLLGMFIHDLGRPWLQHPWLFPRRFVTSRRDIERLAEYGISEVVVDLAKGVHPLEPDEPAAPTPPARPEPATVEQVERRKGVRPPAEPEPLPQHSELTRVRRTYTHALNGVRALVATASSMRKIDLGMAGHMVTDLVDSVFRNRDALLSLIKLEVFDEYDFTHLLNTAAVAVSFGRFLGLSRHQLETLGVGALLQDIGKTHIPEDILKKPGRLTDREFEVAKGHVEAGAGLLQSIPGLPRSAVRLALTHHERMNGEGYPRRLTGPLHPYITISGMADVFDAVSTDRAYKKGIRPHRAVREIFRMRGTEFPGLWVDRFIQCVGIYPPGTIVRLNTGEIGVVIEIHHGQLLRPKVKLITDAQGRPLSRIRTIDLNTEIYLDREIAEALDPEEAGIDPAPYLDPWREV